MDLQETLEASRTWKGPLGGIAFVVLRGLEAGGCSAEELAQVEALLRRAYPNLSDRDCDVLVDVTRTRLDEGRWYDSVRLVGRLTEAVAHIIHDALKQAGIDTRYRNEHGDIDTPSQGTELWIRGRDLEAAEAILAEINETHDDRILTCPSCGETSSADFTRCWNCSAELDA